MNNQIDLQEGFYLEDWFVEPKLGHLTKVTKTAQLEPKIMSVLIYLAENPGSVVSKEELLGKVWKDVYVSHHVLARAISEIRRIFNDNPQNPRVIQTIPKKGYRLIGTIKPKFDRNPDVGALNDFSNVSSKTSNQNKTRLFNLFTGGFVTAFIFFVLILLFLFTRHSRHF